ncbi:MAG TPA: SH3 domain-containing protein [Anaerolineales bacterium]|nr:SH3 domain-containing protein [Anaerolineales bacterium]
MHTKNLLSILVLFSLVTACNLQMGPPTQPADVDTIGTAVELTTIAKFTEMAGSAVSAAATITPAPTLTVAPAAASTSAPVVPVSGPCNPTVTANVNANVRSGPGTAYDAIGSLMQGQAATIVGRNDAYTWWYIDYPGISGGHAWIAGSVVTSSCVPDVVQVVAAPPLPTAVVADASSEDSSNEDSEEESGNTLQLQPMPGLVLSVKKPDLIISEFSISPSTPVMGQTVHVRIGAYNQGDAATGGPYTVVWYGLSTFANPSCSWTVDHSNAHGGRILKCDFVFQSWYPANKTSLAIVDPNDQVNESNESNNQGTISPFGVSKP